MESELPASFHFLSIYLEQIPLLFLLIIFLIFSAIVSSSEVAFFSLNKKKLNELKLINNNNFEKISKLLSDKKRLLSTILILNNFVNIAIVILTAHLTENIDFNSLNFFGFIISKNIIQLLFDMILITLLILFFGEILPKIYAKLYPISVANFAFPIIIIGQIICKPVSNLLIFISNKIEKNFKNNSALTIDELSEALELASEDKNTSDEDHKILEGIVNFGNTVATQVMTPRINMFSISKKINSNELIKLVYENGYSRIPIFDKNIDDICGILYAKDLINHLGKKEFDWHKLINEAYFVPENKKLDDLLLNFQEEKKHLAIVVDEYGGTSGIITLEDVIEEIVGDISDEFDEEHDFYYSKIDENKYSFEGKIPLKDFYRIINAEESIFEKINSDADTLAGFILDISDDYPKKNQIIVFENYIFQIEALDRRRIKMIKVTIQ